jgi:Protein of unknown function (DUF3179)
VWEATVDGRILHFHLAGINNQNFIMRDEETGTWWQQVSGEAILGPLSGRRLKPVFHDELSFGIWKGERPQGRVLRPDEQIASAGKYAPPDWEERMAKVKVVSGTGSGQPLEPRALVIGISHNNSSKAYPLAAVQQQSPVIDSVGGVPLLIVLGEDNRSVRAFERTVDGRKLEFFRKAGEATPQLVDAETGSEWGFDGKATSGPLVGRQLQKVAVLEDYWFDWRIYHPDSALYNIGPQ